ncbi:cytochrome P450 3A12 isoform X2 [Zootoca vivipara]|uniref:cytochrome P450 3A12 isoform X2 n=1 Tax=Zootoca vivipara TaxID=8524 RepID=UPI00158FD8A5|nr:cytochrome P450 3A12 isoform X2 [Zootoca vivipara]
MTLLPSFSTETWSLLIVILGLFMLYGIWPYSHFRNLGIPGPRPLPFFGTLLCYRKGFMNFDTECFQKYGRNWGFYDGRQPILATLDPVIIKTVLVKECYSTFTNRRMFPIIKHYGEVLIQNVQKKVEKDELLVAKDVFGAFSMDVITSTSFGVDLDSMNNPDDPFVKEIKKLTKFSFNLHILLIFVFPFVASLLKLMKITFFNPEAMNFFERSLAKIKATREKEGQGGRVDFLQLMIDSQKSNSEHQSNALDPSYKGLTDDEILAQAFTFVFAGYETNSNSLGYTAYFLAIHPDVQQKLQAEIDTILPDKAPLTYDAIMKLEYLDMVLNETQRLYPFGGRLERLCKKDVEVNGVTILKDTLVMIPPYTLHRDPEYWPEPDEFRPERFSKENKDKIDPYTYLPFGAGPRNCIGMRFALVTMKVAIAILMQHFSFRVCKETPIPLEMSNEAFLVPKKPIVLRLVPRGDPREKGE